MSMSIFGTQGTSIFFALYPAGRIDHQVVGQSFYVLNFHAPFLVPRVEILATWYRSHIRNSRKVLAGVLALKVLQTWVCWPECRHTSTCANTPASTFPEVVPGLHDLNPSRVHA